MSGASVSYPLIAAAVSREDVAAGVSYDRPTFALSYASIAIDAMLDTRGLFRRVRDAVTVPDTALITLAKQFADTYTVSDDPAKLVYKGFSEAVELTETVDIVKFFLRDFADTVTPADVAAVLVDKPFAETQLVSDDSSLVVDKALEDAFGLNDGMGVDDGADFVFASTVSNVATVGDAASLEPLKAAADTYTVADTKALTVEPVAVDSVAVTDGYDTSVAKSLSDTLSVSEIISSILSKVLSDTPSVADSATKIQDKSLSDSATVSAVGDVISQGYCSLTYFESNYVGEYRTFA
jgi:hypothetical protein